MKLLFVINAKAGPGQKDWKNIISSWLNSNTQHQAEWHFPEHNEAGCENKVVSHIKQFKPDRVVAVGGDGTLKWLAGILVQQKVPMAIIPGGSANGMAAELNIPNDESAALEMAIAGKAQPMDLIKINGEWCMHLSDIGLNASLLSHFEQIPQRGMWGYSRALWRLLLDKRNPRIRLQIQADGRKIKRKAVMAVMANATRYGTGAVINPPGKTNDGKFELVIVRRLTIGELIKMLITRKPFNRYNIEIISCRKLQINATPASPFQVDGEYRGTKSTIVAEIYPAAIQVVYDSPE